MGALPKRRHAKARQDKGRSHLKLKPPPLDDCPQCHSPRLSHHVCPTCGTYAGREVIEVEGSKKASR